MKTRVVQVWFCGFGRFSLDVLFVVAVAVAFVLCGFVVGLPFWTFSAPYWFDLAPFLDLFGSLWLPFWLPLGSIWSPFGLPAWTLSAPYLFLDLFGSIADTFS